MNEKYEWNGAYEEIRFREGQATIRITREAIEDFFQLSGKPGEAEVNFVANQHWYRSIAKELAEGSPNEPEIIISEPVLQQYRK